MRSQFFCCLFCVSLINATAATDAIMEILFPLAQKKSNFTASVAEVLQPALGAIMVMLCCCLFQYISSMFSVQIMTLGYLHLWLNLSSVITWSMLHFKWCEIWIVQNKKQVGLFCTQYFTHQRINRCVFVVDFVSTYSSKTSPDFSRILSHYPVVCVM